MHSPLFEVIAPEVQNKWPHGAFRQATENLNAARVLSYRCYVSPSSLPPCSSPREADGLSIARPRSARDLNPKSSVVSFFAPSGLRCREEARALRHCQTNPKNKKNVFGCSPSNYGPSGRLGRPGLSMALIDIQGCRDFRYACLGLGNTSLRRSPGYTRLLGIPGTRVHPGPQHSRVPSGPAS